VRRWLAAAGAVAISTLLAAMAGAGPVLADAANGQDAVVHAAGVMLAVGDVPPALGVGSQSSFISFQGPPARPDLCFVRNRYVSGTITHSSFLAGVEAGDRGRRMVQQTVYEYGSAEAAASAWSGMAAARVRCTESTSYDDNGTTVHGRVSNGRTAASASGPPGIWILEDVSSVGHGYDGNDDAYTVYQLAGTTIQSTAWTDDAKGRVTSGQRAFVDSLALALADRWVSGPPGMQ
jgi:hypothetical protein